MSIEVKDVMGLVAIAVLENASFADIVATMKRYAVGAVTVVDADRRPVGVVSENDLLLKEADPVRHSMSIFESRRRRRDHDKAAGATAVQLMTSPAITVTPGTAVRDAAKLMHTQRIKPLPVIDPVTGRIVGTLHQRDVLRVFTRPAAR
ncbi:CBS domain-containing protein [Nonomuraea sp. NPDC050022]|uniref:CBS domain-containing protein n=1 Tax=Nonomuraea sp. NPDC050022 TaxID=3364358 RepID=UPI0037A86396